MSETLATVPHPDNQELINDRQTYDTWRRKAYDLAPVTYGFTLGGYRGLIKRYEGLLSTQGDYRNFLYLLRSYFRIDPLMRLFYVLVTIAYIIGCVQMYGRTWPRCTSTTGPITDIQYAFKGNDSFVYNELTLPQCHVTFDDKVASQYGIIGYSHVYGLGDSVDLTLCGDLSSPDPQRCYFDDMEIPGYNSNRLVAFIFYGIFGTLIGGFLGFIPFFMILWHDLIIGYAYILAKANAKALFGSDFA